jgi:hypothetical protein
MKQFESDPNEENMKEMNRHTYCEVSVPLSFEINIGVCDGISMRSIKFADARRT